MKTIAITCGDPAGIGPEVIDAALAQGSFPSDCEFLLLGDRDAGTLGSPSRASAQAAMDALNEAAALLQRGDVAGVVTGPVSKEGLQSVGFPHPGQTEFFAEVFGVSNYGMLLSGASLRVALATIHEPLAKVPGMLTLERIVAIGKLTSAFLETLGIASAKLAVCGLNPHAGENGAFGDEEQRVIAPAIEILNRECQARFVGPAVPDAIFRDAAAGSFDAVIAMYHDQGLIPLKLLDFDTAVNVTMGLPKPRVSPDHGTAFGIAGRGLANPSSMIHAIQLACRLA